MVSLDCNFMVGTKNRMMDGWLAKVNSSETLPTQSGGQDTTKFCNEKSTSVTHR